MAVALALPALGVLPSGPADGPAEQPPAGQIVFVSGSNRITVIDVATGQRTARTIGAVAGCGPELVVDGGHVVFAGLTRRSMTVYSLPLSLEGRPRRLGAAHAFVRSATPGRVWLAGSTCTRSQMSGAREMTVDGRVTTSTAGRLPKGWLAGAVESGLLIQRGRRPRVWSPATGRLGARLPLDGVQDTYGHFLASCALHSRCSRMAVVDSRSGNRRAVYRPRGYQFGGSPHFSPDGSLLAVPVVSKKRWALAIGPSSGGVAKLVPGSRTGWIYPNPSWSASSGRLLFRAPGALIKAYLPGEPRAVQTAVRLRHTRPFVAG